MFIPTVLSVAPPTRTVLIVEDERVSRRALSVLLSSSGYTIEAVGSAEEAMDLVTHGTVPEVAVVDLDLPGMSGLDLIAILKRLDPAVHPILVTGADNDRLEAALLNRRVDCLRKPLDFGRLLAMLDDPGRN